jgi:hypothetical protein
MREPELQDWVNTKDPEERIAFKMSTEVALAIDRFFFSHYCNSFRRGAFARANSSM